MTKTYGPVSEFGLICNSCVLQQDNDPKHKVTRKKTTKTPSSTFFKWHPVSLDLDPIKCPGKI